MGDMPPAKALLDHPDFAVVESVAMACGAERMETHISAWEAEGDQLSAAKLAWHGTRLMQRGLIPISRQIDFVYRAASLLAACASDETRNLEIAVLTQASFSEPGSERNQTAMARLRELTAGDAATFDTCTGEGMNQIMTFMSTCGMLGGERAAWPNPTWEHLDEALDCFNTANNLFYDASKLTEDIPKKTCVHLLVFHHLDYVLVSSHSPKWDPEAYGGERALVGLINEYTHRVHGQVFKAEIVARYDSFKCGSLISVLALHYGNLDGLNTWYSKTIAALREIGLAESQEYGNDWLETDFIVWTCIALLFIDQSAWVEEIMHAIGFSWDGVGFEKFWPFVVGVFGNATARSLFTSLSDNFHAFSQR